MVEEKREEGDAQQNQSSDDRSSNMVDNKNNSIKSSSGDSQDQDSNVVDKKNSSCSNTSSDDTKVQGSNMVDNRNNNIKSYSDDSQDQDSKVVEENDSRCSSKSSSGDGKVESKTSEIPAEQEKQSSSNGGDEPEEDASSLVADDSGETKISQSPDDVEEQEKKKSSDGGVEAQEDDSDSTLVADDSEETKISESADDVEEQKKKSDAGVEAQEDDSDSTLVADDSGKTQEVYDLPHDNNGQLPDVGTVKDQSEDDTELKNNPLPSITDKDAYTEERKTSACDRTDTSIQDPFRKIVDDTSTKEVSNDVAIDIPPDTSAHYVSDCAAIDIPPDTSTQDVSASSSSNNDPETSKGFPNEGLEDKEHELKACIQQEDMGSQQEIQNQILCFTGSLSEDVDTGDLDSTSDYAQMENSRSTTENGSVKEHVPDIPDHQKDAYSKSSQSEPSSSQAIPADIPIADSRKGLLQVNVENVQTEEDDLKACTPQGIQNQPLSCTSDSVQMENVPDIPDHQKEADSKSSLSESEKVTADTLNTSEGRGNMEGSPSMTNVNIGTEIPNSNSRIADDMGLDAPECSSNATAGESSSSQVISADIPISDSFQEDLVQVDVENVQTESTPESHNVTAGEPSSISADIANADSSKDLVQVNVENVRTESTPESHNTTAGESSSSQVISADIPISDSFQEDLVQDDVENIQTESTPESHNATAGEPSSISADIANADSSKDLVQVDVKNVQTESTLESQVVIVEDGSAAVSDVVSHASGTISSANENNSDELDHQDGYQGSLEVSAATDNVDSLIQHNEGESSKANQNHEDPDTDSNKVGLSSHNAQSMSLERQTAPSVSTLPCDPAQEILDESTTKQLSEISSSDNNDHQNTQKSHLETSDQPVDENKLCEGSTETVVGDKTAYTVTPKTENKQMEGGKAVTEPHEDPIVQDDHNAGVSHHDAQNVSFEEHQTPSLGMQASGQESFNLDNSQSSGQSLQTDIEVMDSTSQKDAVKKQQHSVSDDADPSESRLPKPDTPPAPSIDTQASKKLPDPTSAAKDDIPTAKKPPTVPVRDTPKYPAANDEEETRLALRNATVSFKSRLAETKTKPVSNLSEIVEEEPNASQGSKNPERKGKGKSWLPFKCCQFDDEDDSDDKATKH